MVRCLAALVMAAVAPACGGSGATGAGPVPDGCITDVAPGAHQYACEGLRVDVSVPGACQRSGCGLIMELHGDTGTGPLVDAHTNLMALGAARGYVVVAPTGPPHPAGVGATWTEAEDEKLIAIMQAVARVFGTDPHKHHLTGLSRG